MSLPLNLIEPCGGTSPMIALTVVERPTPLRPKQADDLAGVDMHVDALQDVALAVIGVQIRDLQHHAASSPR